MPDWDAIAGLRPRRRPRAPRGLQGALGIGLRAALAAALVWLLAQFAEEREPAPADEVLALAFVPEMAPEPPVPTPPALVVSGRFGAVATPFAAVAPATASGGLYLEAVRLAALADGLAVTRAGGSVLVRTPLGPAEAMPATLADRAGLARDCTAFRHEGGLVGLVCAGVTPCAVPDLPEPARALSTALAPACPAPGATGELDGNRDPARASFPQAAHDRVRRGPPGRDGARAPKS